ncbi:flagellar basal body P-ring formation chaperone FlgA [Vibrio crassostreae]|uniref:flagellar basal body P-ring formation chaperone FlgA n=1 Tax=Vibrio crassostreae TaxID=246167 RepID=UPI001B306EFB|nr:flagellar basal body P-ring formation chaperone FlgA [Vibrio crassostreae]
MPRLAFILIGALLGAPSFALSIEDMALDVFLDSAPEVKIYSPNLTFPTHISSKLKSCTPLNIETSSLRKRFKSAKVEISCEDLRQLSFYADVGGSVEVFIASSILKKGIPLSKANLKKEKISLKDLRKGYFNGTSSLSHYSLRKNMKIGDVLYDKHLTLIYDVTSNSVIKAVTEINGIRIETDVVAESDAMVGEDIYVKNKSSGKEFLATVVKKGLVRVK